jgi:hypothetical protein
VQPPWVGFRKSHRTASVDPVSVDTHTVGQVSGCRKRNPRYGANRWGFVISLRKILTVIVCLGWTAITVAASPDGTYQRTRDGRTIVWNDNPKPGDSATWSGKRDRDGYALGFGTLTWYSARRDGNEIKETVFASFFGNMIRGKLDGPVNGHSKGETNHAVFRQGKRLTRWAGGPVPSWRMPNDVDVNASEPPPVTVRIEPPRQQGEFNPPPPSYQPPVPDRPVPGYESLHESEDIPGEGPSGGAVSARPKATPHKKIRIEIDDSLLSLTGEPPSLGNGAPPNASEKRRIAPSERARLEKQVVLGAADSAARDRGYNVNQYQRAEPQFDAMDRTWVVLYEPKSEAAKHFTVAIDDQTGRTAVVSRE